MLYLKEANIEDWEKEYEANNKIPKEENGFVNEYYESTKDEFRNKVIPELINHTKGIGLPEGYVPDTYYYLWDDDNIVGLFKLRHHLNPFLASGPGHIGYTILKEYRGMGYATMGLKLAIKKAKEIIPEDEIYMSVLKNNPASLKVQTNNGAYIISETEEEYLTRIKI